jgi:hypothetical protein
MYVFRLDGTTCLMLVCLDLDYWSTVNTTTFDSYARINGQVLKVQMIAESIHSNSWGTNTCPVIPVPNEGERRAVIISGVGDNSVGKKDEMYYARVV